MHALAVHAAPETVIVANPPGWWRAADTLLVTHPPPPPRHAARVMLKGELSVFNEYFRQAQGSFWTEAFTLKLPSVDAALMELHLPGQPTLRLPTVRDTVYAGTWHSYGPATPLPRVRRPTKAPQVKYRPRSKD